MGDARWPYYLMDTIELFGLATKETTMTLTDVNMRTRYDLTNNDSKSVRAGVELITPSHASTYLDRNVVNRNISRGLVRHYARMMSEGKWTLTGETIVFGDDGTLIDGQHRLAAVVESGVNVSFVVVRNIPAEARQDVDQGRKRTVSDVLTMAEVSDASGLGATASRILRSIHYRQYIAINTGSQYWRASPREVLTFVEEHEEALHHSYRAGANAAITGTPPSLLGSLHWFFAIAETVEDADVFMELLKTGAGLTDSSPILLLRNRLQANAASNSRINFTMVAALTIKAWNAWVNGDTIGTLRWSPGGARPDEFPTIRNLDFDRISW